MKPDQKFFVFDCESEGLHGQTFAIGGGIYDIHGKPVEGSEFRFHCRQGVVGGCGDPNQATSDREWVKANVQIHPESNVLPGPGNVAAAFRELWAAAKAGFPGILMFVECGWPVEARFLIQCVGNKPAERNWEGPYPLHEIATLMLAAGLDPMDSYTRQPEELPAHEPLADARLSARLLAASLRRLDQANRMGEKAGEGPVILHLEEA